MKRSVHWLRRNFPLTTYLTWPYMNNYRCYKF